VRHVTRCREILEEIANCEGDDDWIVPDCMYFLGNLYRDQGKLAVAEEMFRWALQRRDQGPDAKVASTVMLLHNLGSVCYDHGNLMRQRACCNEYWMRNGKNSAMSTD
jgi:hypothetical protein